VALYFVAVEALGNVRKHAEATTTTLTLAERDGHVVLEVHDDGVGFDPDDVDSRSGLEHMADRMAALGGTLLVESRPGGGTWVTATVPGIEPTVQATAGMPLSDPSPTP
jgi:signal transduction histidine kinase